MLVIGKILGHATELSYIGRRKDLVLIEAAEAGRRRLRTRSQDGVDVGIDLSQRSWLFEGAVLHDDGTRILVVSRRPELVMVISLGNISVHDAFRIGHALGNRHSPVELGNDTLIVPVTDTPALTARPVLALELSELTISFETRPFAADKPPTAPGELQEHNHSAHDRLQKHNHHHVTHHG